MKKLNVCLIVFTIVVMVFSMTCARVGPTDPDDPFLPKDKNIGVQYIRQPPVDYIGPDVVILRWNYTNYSGVAAMGRALEDNFSCGAQIKTETRISIVIEDHRKYTECVLYAGHVLKIDGYQFPSPSNGSNCGAREFIYHNDGTIEVIR